MERRRFPIEIPMLVVAETGFETTEQEEEFPVIFKIKQIPIRLLQEVSHHSGRLE